MSDTPVTSHRNTHQYLRPCVEACSDCHKTCLNTVMTHCLEAGGKHLEAEHFRLMINCAEICRNRPASTLS